MTTLTNARQQFIGYFTGQDSWESSCTLPDLLVDATPHTVQTVYTHCTHQCLLIEQRCSYHHLQKKTMFLKWECLGNSFPVTLEKLFGCDPKHLSKPHTVASNCEHKFVHWKCYQEQADTVSCNVLLMLQFKSSLEYTQWLSGSRIQRFHEWVCMSEHVYVNLIDLNNQIQFNHHAQEGSRGFILF